MLTCVYISIYTQGGGRSFSVNVLGGEGGGGLPQLVHMLPISPSKGIEVKDLILEYRCSWSNFIENHIISYGDWAGITQDEFRIFYMDLKDPNQLFYFSLLDLKVHYQFFCYSLFLGLQVHISWEKVHVWTSQSIISCSTAYYWTSRWFQRTRAPKNYQVWRRFHVISYMRVIQARKLIPEIDQFW